MLKQTGLTMCCAIIKNVKIQKYIFWLYPRHLCRGYIVFVFPFVCLSFSNFVPFVELLPSFTLKQIKWSISHQPLIRKHSYLDHKYPGGSTFIPWLLTPGSMPRGGTRDKKTRTPLKSVFLLFMPRHQKVAGYYVIPSEILSVRLSVRPSVSAHHHSCIGNSSYSFRPILLKLYRCFKDGLKICILFFQNPEIIFYHFFSHF